MLILIKCLVRNNFNKVTSKDTLSSKRLAFFLVLPKRLNQRLHTLLIKDGETNVEPNVEVSTLASFDTRRSINWHAFISDHQASLWANLLVARDRQASFVESFECDWDLPECVFERALDCHD